MFQPIPDQTNQTNLIKIDFTYHFKKAQHFFGKFIKKFDYQVDYILIVMI